MLFISQSQYLQLRPKQYLMCDVCNRFKTHLIINKKPSPILPYRRYYYFCFRLFSLLDNAADEVAASDGVTLLDDETLDNTAVGGSDRHLHLHGGKN